MYISIWHVEDVARERARRVAVHVPSALVGSDPSCEVVIDDDPEVAARHLRVTMQRGGAIVEDLETATGTTVDGAKLTEATEVPPGVHVRIGQTVLTIRVPASPWVEPRFYPGREPSTRVAPPPLPPDEQALLAAVRERPDDEAAREVYSDWLEQHGEFAKASFVRSDVGLDAHRDQIFRETSVAWRSALARSPLPCNRKGCTRRWEQLALTEDVRARRCSTCERTFLYREEIEQDVRRDAITPVIEDATTPRFLL